VDFVYIQLISILSWTPAKWSGIFHIHCRNMSLSLTLSLSLTQTLSLTLPAHHTSSTYSTYCTSYVCERCSCGVCETYFTEDR